MGHRCDEDNGIACGGGCAEHNVLPNDGGAVEGVLPTDSGRTGHSRERAVTTEHEGNGIAWLGVCAKHNVLPNDGGAVENRRH